MSLTLVSPPTGEPITLDAVKTQCRIDNDVEDELLLGYMQGAREYLEEISGRKFLLQTWDYTIDWDWPPGNLIYSPFASLVSVNFVQYVDTSGVTQTLDSSQYVVDTGDTVGRIYPAYSVVLPNVNYQENAITARLTVGYGADGSSVPQAIQSAMLLLVQHLYSRSTDPYPPAIDMLMAPFRVTSTKFLGAVNPHRGVIAPFRVWP